MTRAMSVELKLRTVELMPKSAELKTTTTELKPKTAELKPKIAELMLRILGAGSEKVRVRCCRAKADDRSAKASDLKARA